MTTEKEKQRLINEKEFLNRKNTLKPLENTSHPSGVKKGDLVVVQNAYGISVGPFKVLGFSSKSKEPKMYLDWDCHWFPKKCDDIIRIIKKKTTLSSIKRENFLHTCKEEGGQQ